MLSPKITKILVLLLLAVAVDCPPNAKTARLINNPDLQVFIINLRTRFG